MAPLGVLLYKHVSSEFFWLYKSDHWELASATTYASDPNPRFLPTRPTQQRRCLREGLRKHVQNVQRTEQLCMVASSASCPSGLVEVAEVVAVEVVVIVEVVISTVEVEAETVEVE